MRRISVVGLFLVAAFAISAVAGASASAALPEFSGPFPKPFSSTGGKVSIETVGKIKASCVAETNAGEVTGAKSGTVTLKLTGCAASGFKCSTKGAAEGEVRSNPLTSTLGYINKATKEVGIDLKPAKGAIITTFECGPAVVTVTGSIIGKVTPVNKKVSPGKPFALTFAQAKGKQKPSKLEGGPTDVPMGSVNGGVSQEAGLSAKVKLTFKEATEIKA